MPRVIEAKSVPLAQLKVWSSNPRRITKQNFERLKAQITRLGRYQPLVVNEDMVVLSGNMRLKAYIDLKIDPVDVVVVEARDEATMIEYALSANDLAGEYVEEELAELIHDQPIELDLYSVHLSQPISLAKLMEQETGVEEDEAPPVADVAVSKLGEIYQLGRHRLGCMDSTVKENVELLMDGNKADMVFTDPPYGVDYEGKTKEKLKIQNDKTTNVWADVLPNFIANTKAGATFYVCCPAGNNFKDFFLPFEEYCHLSATIIWAKNSLVMGHGDYHYKHEPILYGWNKEGSHKFYGDRSQTTVWDIDRPTASREHPTMKPLALIAKALNNSSKSGDITLDLFGGSGSTLIACEQLDRTCFMAEIDPKYIDVCRRRYHKFVTGSEEGWELSTPAIDTTNG